MSVLTRTGQIADVAGNITSNNNNSVNKKEIIKINYLITKIIRIGLVLYLNENEKKIMLLEIIDILNTYKNKLNEIILIFLFIEIGYIIKDLVKK